MLRSVYGLSYSKGSMCAGKGSSGVCGSMLAVERNPLRPGGSSKFTLGHVFRGERRRGRRKNRNPANERGGSPLKDAPPPHAIKMPTGNLFVSK